MRLISGGFVIGATTAVSSPVNAKDDSLGGNDMSMSMDAMTTDHSLKSEAFAVVFEGAVKGSFADYTVDVTRPEATTYGGAQALLHIRLTTREGVALVIGSANRAKGTAQLRTLGYVLSLSKRRFGKELAIPVDEYLHFFDVATRVMKEFALALEIVAYDQPRGN
jgi:hypothetical protein